MKRENIIQQKSFAFAIRIINLYKYLYDEKRELVLSKKLLKSVTSIGSNVEEAFGSQSDNDSLSKMSIAYKESEETLHCLNLLFEKKYLDKEQFESLHNEAEELCRIIEKIQITMKDQN
jgi:four helix bundle protein